MERRDRSPENSFLNTREVAEFSISLLPRAGQILREAYDSRMNLTYFPKANGDFATNVDIELEEFLRKEIRDRFPTAEILGEETAPEDYSDYKKFENLFIIDPIDGTTNFSRGRSSFSVSLAFVKEGIPLVGVIYIPTTEDLIYAEQGHDGAFCIKKNDEIRILDMHVSENEDLNKAVIGSDLVSDPIKRKKVMQWIDKLQQSNFRMWGSPVLSLGSVALGELDGYINSGLKPWDMAASSLVIEKAGGKEEDIFASNGVLHEQLLHSINGAK